MQSTIILFLAFLLFPELASAQGQKNRLRFSSVLAPEIYGPRYLSSDLTGHYRPRSVMLQNSSSTTHHGDSYYMGTMTTQSYNHGKMGTFYYWDVQGNLRESKFFLDIAGKNKRGLKLVFPRR